jgi:salicylate hydroxylase
VNFVGVTEHDTWRNESWTERGDKADLVNDFRDWHPTVRAVVAEIDEPFRWALFARQPLAKWSDGRVSLLGDACHPMLPYLAQGANMAIEDGYVLAQCLKAARGDVAGALKRYETLRLARTARVQAGARANGGLFHLANPLARFLTYGALALGSRVAPAVAARRNDWLMSYDATKQVSQTVA